MLAFWFMIVAIIVIAWVCSSTVFCLALLGAAANSIPQSDEHIVPENRMPSSLGLSPSPAACCTAL